MKTYIEERLAELGESEDIDLFERVRSYLKDKEFDSCHSASHAVAEEFDLKKQTGFWVVGFEHSWCVTKHGNVVDPYPVGTYGGPILVSREVRGPWIYQEKKA